MRPARLSPFSVLHTRAEGDGWKGKVGGIGREGGIVGRRCFVCVWGVDRYAEVHVIQAIHAEFKPARPEEEKADQSCAEQQQDRQP